MVAKSSLNVLKNGTKFLEATEAQQGGAKPNNGSKVVGDVQGVTEVDGGTQPPEVENVS